MAIAALVVWLLTAAAGVSLLVTGQVARKAPPAGEPLPGYPPPGHPSPGQPSRGDLAAGPPASGGVATPVTRVTELPPIPYPRVHADPGDHPLLEFTHPALGLIGFGLWFIFVGTHYHPLAWVAFGVLVVGAGAGLRWLAANTLAARRGQGGPAQPGPAQPGPAQPGPAQPGPAQPGPGRPGQARPGRVPRLAILHGVAAAGTLALVVLTALAASHG